MQKRLKSAIKQWIIDHWQLTPPSNIDAYIEAGTLIKMSEGKHLYLLPSSNTEDSKITQHFEFQAHDISETLIHKEKDTGIYLKNVSATIKADIPLTHIPEPQTIILVDNILGKMTIPEIPQSDIKNLYHHNFINSRVSDLIKFHASTIKFQDVHYDIVARDLDTKQDIHVDNLQQYIASNQDAIEILIEQGFIKDITKPLGIPRCNYTF